MLSVVDTNEWGRVDELSCVGLYIVGVNVCVRF